MGVRGISSSNLIKTQEARQQELQEKERRTQTEPQCASRTARQIQTYAWTRNTVTVTMGLESVFSDLEDHKAALTLFTLPCLHLDRWCPRRSTQPVLSTLICIFPGHYMAVRQFRGEGTMSRIDGVFVIIVLRRYFRQYRNEWLT